MAVPKKRTSKSKKNLRKTVWKKKAVKSAIQSYFIAYSIKKQGEVEKKTLTKGFGDETKENITKNEKSENKSSEENTK